MRPSSEQQRRAGLAIRIELDDIGMTLEELAGKASLDPTTVRAVVNGRRKPRPATLRAIVDVLGWDVDELARRARGNPRLASVSTPEIIRELCSRYNGDHPEAPESGS